MYAGVGMMRLCGIVLARAILEAHPVVQEVVSTADASRTFYRSRPGGKALLLMVSLPSFTSKSAGHPADW